LKAALYQMVLHRPFEPARVTGKVAHITYLAVESGTISITNFFSPERGIPVARRKQKSKLTRTEKKMASIQSTLHSLIRRAAPSSANKTVSWTAVDLASLWEVSVNHQRHIRLLLQCSYPKDRHKIQNLLTEIRVNLLSQGADNLSTLQRGLPAIISAVYNAKSTPD
jgi:hypothetical protein